MQPKLQKRTSCNWVALKKKKKGIKMGPVPLGRSYGEGKVLSPRKPPSPAGRSARTEGSFGDSEESAAAGLWQEKHRYTSTEGPG